MPPIPLVTQTSSDVTAGTPARPTTSLSKHPPLLGKLISSPLAPVVAGYAVAGWFMMSTPPIIMDFPRQNPPPNIALGLTMIVGPLAGCLMALWHLLRRRRIAESLASLVLGAPVLLLILDAASWLLRF